MKEAKAGAGGKIPKLEIKDPKYPVDTWNKMQHVHKGLDGNNITIHYWKNIHTGELKGFKYSYPP